MPFIDLADDPEHEPVAGYRGRFVRDDYRLVEWQRSSKKLLRIGKRRVDFFLGSGTIPLCSFHQLRTFSR